MKAISNLWVLNFSIIRIAMGKDFLRFLTDGDLYDLSHPPAFRSIFAQRATSKTNANPAPGKFLPF